MSKKQKKFRDIWVNQTTLGKAFNLSAVAIGKKLKEQQLREADGNPTASFPPLVLRSPSDSVRSSCRSHIRKNTFVPG